MFRGTAVTALFRGPTIEASAAAIAAALLVVLGAGPAHATLIGVQGKAATEFFGIVTGVPDEAVDSGLLTAPNQIGVTAASTFSRATAFSRMGYNSVTLRTPELPGDFRFNQQVRGLAFSRWTQEFTITGGAGNGVATFVGSYHAFLSNHANLTSLMATLTNVDLSRVLDPGVGFCPLGWDSPFANGLLCNTGGFVPPDNVFTDVPGGVFWDGSVRVSIPFTYDVPFPLSGVLYTAGVINNGSMFHSAELTLSDVILPAGATLENMPSLTAPGLTQDDPRLPMNTLPDGTFEFFGVPSGYYVDPILAHGYHFEMSPGGSLFTDILSFPTGFASTFEVSSPGCTIPGTFGPGMSVDFSAFCGADVASFDITGIDPLVDAADPLAFPVQLAYNTPTADFTMTALIAPTQAPAPATFVLLALGLAGLGYARRRHGFSA